MGVPMDTCWLQLTYLNMNPVYSLYENVDKALLNIKKTADTVQNELLIHPLYGLPRASSDFLCIIVYSSQTISLAVLQYFSYAGCFGNVAHGSFNGNFKAELVVLPPGSSFQFYFTLPDRAWEVVLDWFPALLPLFQTDGLELFKALLSIAPVVYFWRFWCLSLSGWRHSSTNSLFEWPKRFDTKILFCSDVCPKRWATEILGK